MTVPCPVCDAPCHEAFQADVLHKYRVDYFQCTDCGLVRTEDPYWLEEARASSIADADTGLLARNVDLSKRLCALVYLLNGGRGTYLDASGGYGVMTRLMRDVGLDYFWEDPYCQNLFARGFERKAGQVYSAISALEVLEHVVSPVELLSGYLAEDPAPSILITTETFDGPGAPPRDWWYYSFETGQHVVLYSKESMRRLARRLGTKCVAWRRFHIFTKNDMFCRRVQLLTVPYLWNVAAWAARATLRSRTKADRDICLRSGRGR